MAVENTCPACGATLPADLPESVPLCPRCLLKPSLASPNPLLPPIEPEPHELEIPGVTVSERIARGGMGAVYLGHQPHLNREICIKILAPELRTDPEFVIRFRRETQALANLNHPNIVTLYDAGETDRYLYLLMEYVDGRHLGERIASEPMPPEKAAQVIAKIGAALSYAHSKGIAHRDIKPANVLTTTQDGQLVAKLTDFGLAKLTHAPASELTTVRQPMGTARYMAPEQWENAESADHRSDIYSLGALYYELLTQRIPSGNFPKPASLAKIPPATDRAIMTALEQEPDQRQQSVDEFLAAICLPLKSKSLGPFAAGIAVALLALLALVSMRQPSPPVPPETPIGQGPVHSGFREISTSVAQYVSSPTRRSSLGRAVALSDGLLVAGAPQGGHKRDDLTGTGFATVHRVIYRHQGFLERLHPVTTLTAGKDAKHGDNFGYSVSVSGTLIACGAEGKARNNGDLAGAVFLFRTNGEELPEIAPETVLVPDMPGDLRFGTSLSLDDHTLLVSAPAAKQNQGAAYIYESTEPGEWVETAQLLSPTPQGAGFGSFVSLSKDTAVVGAPLQDGPRRNARTGCVFIYERNAGGKDTWGQVSELYPPEPQAGMQFGYRVSLFHDQLLVGAHEAKVLDDEGRVHHVGRAFLYTRTPDGWAFAAELDCPEKGVRRFGDGLTFFDGLCLVGAPESKEKTGRAYAFERQADGEWQCVTKISSRVTHRDRFGAALSADEKGFVIGSSFFHTSERDERAGGAFLFPLPALRNKN